MGLCPINNGFMTFDPNRSYSDDGEGGDALINPGLIIVHTPPSPCDNVSLLSNFSQSPHCVQLTGVDVGSPPYLPGITTSSSSSGGPYNHSPKDCTTIRTSCTSIDSGYEKSMSMSSFTSSAKEPISLVDSDPRPTQYGSTGDVASSHSKPESGTLYDNMETKPRARSLCDMERKEIQDDSVSCNLSGKPDSGLYPKLPSLTPQLVIEDFTLHVTNRQALEAKLNDSTSTCNSDCSTPVGPLSKSATPSPTSSVDNATNAAAVLQPSSKAELRRAFFTNKGKKAKGIRTIEDSKMKQQQMTSPTSDIRPRSDAICFSRDCHWKTKSCDVDAITTSMPPVAPPTEANDNLMTSTPTYFGSRTLGSNTSISHPHHQVSSNRFNPSWNMCTPTQCPPDLPAVQCDPQGCYNFPVNSKLYAELSANGPPSFGSSNRSSFGGTPCSKSGTQASVSMVTAATPTLILLSDAQSVISETDSGHCTKSIDDRSQADIDLCSQASELSHLSNLDNTSEYSEADNDVFTARQRGVVCRQTSHRNQLDRLCQRNQHASLEESSVQNPEASLSASCIKLHRDNPSVLHEKLREYEDTIFNGRRPQMLEQFEDFTDVELPTFDEFCLDDSTPEMVQGGGSGSWHRHRMGDFGHSLFAG